MKRKLVKTLLLIPILIGVILIAHYLTYSRSQLAIVCQAVAQASTLNGLIDVYKERYGRMPMTLDNLNELDFSPTVLSAVQFHDFNNDRFIPWVYYRDGISTSEGKIYVLTPISFNSDNSELKKEVKEMNYRVALFEDGSVAIVKENELKSEDGKLLIPLGVQ